MVTGMCAAREIVCRVPFLWHSAKLASPSVNWSALGKDWLRRVSTGRHSAKIGFAECQVFAKCVLASTRQKGPLPSARYSALGKAPGTRHKWVSSSDTSLPYLFPACSIYSKILQYNWSIECKTIVFQEYNYKSSVPSFHRTNLREG